MMWSYLLTALGCTALWLAGSKEPVWRRSGWALGFAAQHAWFWYGVSTDQYGFILSSFVYGWVYLRNLVKANRGL
jgi:hypothetical protein